jgi:hypothetical protein
MMLRKFVPSGDLDLELPNRFLRPPDLRARPKARGRED